MRKIGWSGAIRRSSSLVEVASTPAKNTPTSHFHRSRYDRRIPSLLVGVRNLRREEVLAVPPEQEVSFTRHAQVAHPLRVTAWSDEILGSFECQQIHRRPTGLSGLPTPDLEDARTPHADPQTREPGYHPIDDVAREPARCEVSRRQGFIVSAYVVSSPLASVFGRSQQATLRGDRGAAAATPPSRACFDTSLAPSKGSATTLLPACFSRRDRRENQGELESAFDFRFRHRRYDGVRLQS